MTMTNVSKLGVAVESSWMLRHTRWVLLIVACLAPWLLSSHFAAAQTAYPQQVKVRYEAQDQKAGGHFIVWVEREKIWYGLDQRLYPAAKSVEITHITPAPGSPTITVIAVTSINATTPDYFHLIGIVRFRTTGMVVRSSNIP
jgi:hypothetical protein